MYRKIMVPLDGSRLAECVLPHVESLVTAGQVAEVVFARVIEPFNNRFDLVSGEAIQNEEEVARHDAEAKAAGENYIKKIANRVKSDRVTIGGAILVGTPSVQLSEYANHGGFDLIIIATHGRSGISRWVWGSVADRLLRAVCMPVFMIRAPGCVPGI